MEETRLAGRCPRCGRPLALDAPEGLCPACLLEVAVEPPTSAGESEALTVLSASPAAAAAGDRLRLEPGQRFGPYAIVKLLGRGGMGEVYEAEHQDSGRRVALKVLRGRLHDRDERARFLREGQLAASVSHPHTVYIYGSEDIAGAPVISMELLPGGTLRDRVAAGGPLAAADAVAAVLDIIGGLDAAQAVGILHRDIKPSNCFVDVDGVVKVGDFGLSISTLARDVEAGAAPQGFEGTPQFAAPEQLRGEPLDVRADIYAVGATLYYLLTGQPPFDARDLRELMTRVTTEPPPSLRQLRRDVPAGLAMVVQQCLAKEPQQRPASYAALADALRPYSTGSVAPAGLGIRLVAGAVDTVLLSLPFSFAATITLDRPTRGTFTSVDDTAVWGMLASAVYYVLLEGAWGASLGKRLFGLKVVTAAGTRATWPAIALRTLVFHLPVIAVLLVFFGLGPTRVAALMELHVTLAVAFSLARLGIGAALFLTARRRNGFAAVHELASGTRVVHLHSKAARGRTLLAPVTAVRHPAPVPAVGPFEVTADLGPVEGGRLLAGFDPRLRRHVWLRVVAAGTPPIADARRDIARVTRLRWLAGRRSRDENWDAFEAPDGAPWLRHAANAPWPVAKHWLRDIVNELEASTRETTTPALSAASLWLRPDGHVVLLDFPAPGAPRGTRTTPTVAAEPAGPAGATDPAAASLLRDVAAAVAGSASQGGSSSPDAMPLSAARLLERWARHAPASLDAARNDLTAALGSLDETPRLRRASLILFAAVPIVLAIIGSIGLAPAMRAAMRPEMFEMYSLIAMLQTPAGQSGAPRDDAHRTAIEVYLAGRRASLLTDDGFWRQPAVQSLAARFRPTAEAIARAHPNVAEEALARAEDATSTDRAAIMRRYDATIAPQIQQGALVSVVSLVAIAAAVPLVLQVLAALIRPAGLLAGALGLTLVTHTGVPIGRGRALARLVIAWAPLLLWAVWLGWPLFPAILRQPVLAAWLLGAALAIMSAGAIWSIVHRVRGPHDILAGTSMVPK